MLIKLFVYMFGTMSNHILKNELANHHHVKSQLGTGHGSCTVIDGTNALGNYRSTGNIVCQILKSL